MKKDGHLYTLGDSPAALILYTKLKDNKKLLGAVGGILGRFNTKVNEIELSGLSAETMKYLLGIMRKDYQDKVRKINSISEDIQSLCDNLMKKKIKSLIECYNL